MPALGARCHRHHLTTQRNPFAHECAHHVALTRVVGQHGASRADAETIAEGAAFAVLARFGLDSGDYSFPYVAAWAADRAVLARNLAAIRETAAILIAAVEGGLVTGIYTVRNPEKLSRVG